jgi:hypothetical protein
MTGTPGREQGHLGEDNIISERTGTPGKGKGHHAGRGQGQKVETDS